LQNWNKVPNVVCLQTHFQNCNKVHSVVCLQTQLQDCKSALCCLSADAVAVATRAVSILSDCVRGYVFWDLTTFRLINSYRRFGGTYFIHLQVFGSPRRFSSFLQQPLPAVICQSTWLASYPRRLDSTSVRQVELAILAASTKSNFWTGITTVGIHVSAKYMCCIFKSILALMQRLSERSRIIGELINSECSLVRHDTVCFRKWIPTF
jgi:hypothetical protein